MCAHASFFFSSLCLSLSTLILILYDFDNVMTNKDSPLSEWLQTFCGCMEVLEGTSYYFVGLLILFLSL